MADSGRKILFVIIMVASAALLVVFYSLAFRAKQASGPPAMPPVVEESMDDLLEALEMEVEKYDPAVIQSLRPGMTEDELDQAEAALGQAIHPEMRALYRWHNGAADSLELFPGYGFWSLEEAIQTNQEFNRNYQEKGFSAFMAHEKHWLILFPDPAGDGYYYDPKINYESGGVFYNFREAGYYRYFPSIRNLIEAVIEGYQEGAYLPGGDTDFDLEDKIMNRYGIAVEGQ